MAGKYGKKYSRDANCVRKQAMPAAANDAAYESATTGADYQSLLRDKLEDAISRMCPVPKHGQAGR